MTAAAFDTLKFARTLREKAHLSPEQAEGPADAMVEMLDGNLATKADIRELRSDVEALRIQMRADIEALRLATKADTEALELSPSADIAALKSESLKGMLGTVEFQTIVILGAVITPVRALH